MRAGQSDVNPLHFHQQWKQAPSNPQTCQPSLQCLLRASWAAAFCSPFTPQMLVLVLTSGTLPCASLLTVSPPQPLYPSPGQPPDPHGPNLPITGLLLPPRWKRNRARMRAQVAATTAPSSTYHQATRRRGLGGSPLSGGTRDRSWWRSWFLGSPGVWC